MSGVTLSLAAAEARIAALLVRHGAREDVAVSVARALVAAEADGLTSHGLTRIPTYVAMLKAGKADGQARPVVTRPRPAVLAVDAAHGYAYPALDLALSALPAVAREQGVALALIRRSNHCGAAGHPVERLAAQGLVALMMANAPAAMAPWGGRRAVYGTNPIAFAAPLPGRPPLVVDLALSKVARGNLVVARQRGEAIPEGWALDPEGRPTTDPAAGIAGTMVPMGDAKGAALALMVEVMAGALAGALLGPEASSFLDAEGPPPGTGQMLLAIDPVAGTAEAPRGFLDGMAALVAAIEAQEGARLPGQRRLAARARAAAEGITFTTQLEAEIARLG